MLSSIVIYHIFKPGPKQSSDWFIHGSIKIRCSYKLFVLLEKNHYQKILTPSVTILVLAITEYKCRHSEFYIVLTPWALLSSTYGLLVNRFKSQNTVLVWEQFSPTLWCSISVRSWCIWINFLQCRFCFFKQNFSFNKITSGDLLSHFCPSSSPQ